MNTQNIIFNVVLKREADYMKERFFENSLQYSVVNLTLFFLKMIFEYKFNAFSGIVAYAVLFIFTELAILFTTVYSGNISVTIILNTLFVLGNTVENVISLENTSKKSISNTHLILIFLVCIGCVWSFNMFSKSIDKRIYILERLRKKAKTDKTFNLGDLCLWVLPIMSVCIGLVLCIVCKGLWLSIGGFSIQLTEFLKPVFVLFHAVLIYLDVDKKLLYSSIMLIINAVFLLLLSELGTLLVLMLIWITFTLFFMKVRISKKALVMLSCIAILGIVFAVIVMLCIKSGKKVPTFAEIAFTKIYKRFTIFNNLDSISQEDIGYQASQARKAIINGGLWGSTEKIPIPVEESDYVFVSLINRMGIVFAMLVFVLFIIMTIKVITLALNFESNKFIQTFFIGSVLQIVYPMIVNVLGTTNFLLMTGIAIPFFSHGGTNLLISMFNSMIIIFYLCRKEPQSLKHKLNEITSNKNITESDYSKYIV